MENSNERKSRRSLPAWAVLTIITLVAAMCLGGTYQMTKDTIAQRTAEEAEATRKALLPDAAAFEEAEASSLDSFYVGKTKEQDDVGYVGVSTVQGFGGEVEVTVGTDADGKITGVRVGGPNFSETAGLGAKTKEPAFYEQFTGKTYPVKLTKDGGEIDAVTSATVTSSAVVRAVNDTVKAMSETAGFHIEEPVSAIEELGNGSYGISGQGVTGAFPIVVNLDGAGAVQSVEVKDSESAMDGSYLSKVQGDPAFLGQFTGKTSVDSSQFDTVSGATVSSNSIIDSVGNVLLYVNDPEAYAAQQTSVPAATPEKTEVSGSNGEYTVSAKGLTGTFDVNVALDGSGAVNAVALGEASSDMDAEYLAKVKGSDTFLAQFVGKSGEIAESDIDTVSGATISSKAVLDAVNTALASAGSSVPVDGTTVTANGLTGTFDVTVALDGSGAVSGVTLGEASSEMDAEYLAKVKGSETFLAQFVGKSGEIAESGIDTVSGATISSKAVLGAVNTVLASAAPAAPEAPAASGEGTTVTANGLTGTFDVTVALDGSGAVSGVTLGEASSEMDAEYLSKVKGSENFLAQFVGKSGEIAESGIDTVSGATISSKAVLGAVNTVLASAAPAAPEAPAASGEGATVTANGLTGTFDVTVALDGSGAVSGVTLGEASSEMDAEYLAKVKGSDTFLAQFVGKSGEIAESGIDTVSGATISSKAVLGVVNTVLASAAPAASLETVPTESFPEDSGETVSDTSSDLTAIATTTARAKGVTGAFDVIIGLNSEGAVCSVELGDSDSEADYLYLKAVKEDKAFLNQFIGKTEVLSESDIDSVSGATVTSRAVLDAVNAAIASADDVLQAAKVPMFERTIKAKGMTGTFDVTVGINESGAVCGVAVGESNSEADYLYLKAVRESEKFLSQFTGKKNTVSANEIDTISGATLSSKAVLEAVNTVLALGDESAAAQTAEDEKTEPTAEPEPQATPTAVPAAATTAEPTPKPAEEYDGTRVKAKGETGTFDVSISLDENGAVSGVEIGRSTSEADELYLFAVKESEPFLAQLIGRTDYISPEGIDTVSGATVSSLAVVNAVNTLAGFPEPESPPHSADEKTTGASAETETEPAVDSPVPAVPAAPEAPAASDEGTTVTANGLTGTFDVTVALDGSGAVSGVTLGEASSEMDAEYLAKVKGSETFLAQFVGKSGEIAESGIDTVSGATISSKAVLGVVNTVLASAAPAAPEAPAASDEGTTVTANGLTGTFDVTVALDGSGAVSGVTLGEASSEMDAEYLAKVKGSETFLAQFVGKSGEIAESGIDTVSGATISSKAVLGAVNTVLASAAPTAPEAITETEIRPETVPAVGDTANTSYVTASGLTGNFGVAVSLDENNTVCGIEIGPSDSEADTDYLDAVKSDRSFLDQFVGKKDLISEDEIDAVSGATVSSKAVLNAVNLAVTMANGGIFIEPTLAPTARPTAAPTAIPTARPTKDPVPEAADDGDTWITVKGLTGTFKVAVSLDETGAVTGIVIGETTSEADEAYLSAVKDSETFLSQFIGRTGTISVNDIDTVSGATVSSKAVLDAVNTVLNSAYETER